MLLILLFEVCPTAFIFAPTVNPKPDALNFPQDHPGNMDMPALRGVFSQDHYNHRHSFLPRHQPATGDHVFDLSENIPEKAVEIGTIAITDNGFTTDCGWETVLNKARQEAARAGGNALKITRHIEPRATASTCHQLYATILYMDKAMHTSQLARKEAADSALHHMKRVQTRQAEVEKANAIPYDRFCIGFHAGFSRMSAAPGSSTPEFLKYYVRELNQGLHIGANGTFYFRENFGIGFRYSRFTTSGTYGGSVVITDAATGKERIGGLSDDITIEYFAPAFCTKLQNKKKTVLFFGDFSVGYTDYKNKAVLVDPYTLTGHTFAWTADFGIDLKLSKNLAFTPGVSFVNGSMNDFVLSQNNQRTGVNTHPYRSKSISRIDFHVGLRFLW